MLKNVSRAVLVVIVVSTSLFAQQAKKEDKSKRPSPPATAQCKLPDGKAIITVDYSSPRLRGRELAQLEPPGEVWRTGANEATTFVTTENLTAPKGIEIPAGSYTLFTVPDAEKWTLIINKHTGEWGIPYHYESEELPRIPMTVSKLSSPVEDFTVSFDQAGKGCTMHLSWGDTQASVEFAVK